MKRSSCLSALLVGLSLTTATAALAAPAPAPTDAPAVKKVAQAQDPSTGTNGTAAPSDQSSPQPAVSVGTSTTTTPGSDTPASGSEPQKKPVSHPWAGSSLFATQSVTTNTIFRGQTQYDNPTTESNLYILPRYALTEKWQLRARAIVSWEETNSDGTTYAHEPQLSDTTFQLFRSLPRLPLGISPKVAVNVTLPTSKGSQARTMVAAPGATLQLARPFENVLGGDVALIGFLTYTHPFYRSKNPEFRDDPPGTLSCVGGNNCTDLVSGTMNTSDALSYAFIVSGEWGKWNPAIYYLGAHQWAYHPKDVTYMGQPVSGPPGFEPFSIRQSHYLSAWIDYNFNPWLTAEVGYWNAVNAVDGRSQRSNVVFARYNGDTRVYLGFSVQIDNLIRELQGAGEGDGGIVRAKNTRSGPVMTF